MIYLLLVFLLSFSQSYQCNEDLTTVILVRHAETIADIQNPGLSKAGQERALSLAAHLETADITAIYSTPYNRTLETANVAAKNKHLKVHEYDPFNAKALDNIIEQHRGSTILIVGHSNTTPGMVNRLIGEHRFEDLSESDYGNLYIVTLTQPGKGKAVHLQY